MRRTSPTCASRWTISIVAALCPVLLVVQRSRRGIFQGCTVYHIGHSTVAARHWPTWQVRWHGHDTTCTYRDRGHCHELPWHCHGSAVKDNGSRYGTSRGSVVVINMARGRHHTMARLIDARRKKSIGLPWAAVAAKPFHTSHQRLSVVDFHDDGYQNTPWHCHWTARVLIVPENEGAG